MSELKHFLLVFDHSLGRLVRCDPYDDVAEAIRAYSAAEREHERNGKLEIVLIGSDSIETVRRTHSNYFDGSVASPYFADL